MLIIISLSKPITLFNEMIIYMFALINILMVFFSGLCKSDIFHIIKSRAPLSRNMQGIYEYLTQYCITIFICD